MKSINMSNETQVGIEEVAIAQQGGQFHACLPKKSHTP
jgi:hypothetical protein